MALLRARVAFCLSLALTVCGCGESTLSTFPSELLDVQRQAGLTRVELDGVWQGSLSAQESPARQTIHLVFTQPNALLLDGSILVRERIELGGTVSRDTFALINGVFDKPAVRFNLGQGGTLIVFEGAPVFYRGVLSENDFISGEVVSGSILIGNWEVRLRGGQSP